jgi:hypothetical protein
MKILLNVIGITTIFFCFSCAKPEDLAKQIPPVTIEPKLSNASESSEVNFSVDGGVGFYKFKILSGTADINSETGVLTAMSPGQVVIRVYDLIGNFDDAVVNVSRDFSLNVSRKYLSYNQQFNFQYSGGTPPVVFSRISGDGQIDSDSGLFVASSTLSKTVIKATDAEGNVQVAEVYVVPTLQFDELNLVLTYDESHTFQLHGGVPPYSFSLIAGSGTLLADQGVFVAPHFDNYPVVRVTDSVGLSRDIQIHVIEKSW